MIDWEPYHHGYLLPEGRVCPKIARSLSLVTPSIFIKESLCSEVCQVISLVSSHTNSMWLWKLSAAPSAYSLLGNDQQGHIFYPYIQEQLEWKPVMVCKEGIASMNEMNCLRVH